MRWLHWFVQPLYEPQTFIGLGYGYRIPNREAMGISETPVTLFEPDTKVKMTPELAIQAMIEEGLPNLDKTAKLGGFYEYCFKGAYSEVGARYWQWWSISLTSLLLHMPLKTSIEHLETTAERVWNRLQQDAYSRTLYYDEPYNPHVPRDASQLYDHERVLLEQISLLKCMLVEGDLQSAMKQLSEWEQYTVKSLGLESVYDDSPWEEHFAYAKES